MKGLILVIWGLMLGSAYAQTYDFGDVPIESLEMQVYEKDSTAKAVVLFDKGFTDIDYRNDRFNVVFKRHVRIKILTDEGLDLGDIGIRFRRDDPKQVIRDIEAQSYTLNSNGEIEKASVGRRDRYEDKIADDLYEVKFTIPGLKAGSVFEYEYERFSEHPLDFPDWFFQREIPTMYSEYVTRIPEWFTYLTVTRGFHNYFVKEEVPYNDRIMFRDAYGGAADLSYQGNQSTYAMRDIPAIGDEPYMRASVDYLAHLRFKLSVYHPPGGDITNYIGNWNKVVKNLMDSKNFGKKLKSSRTLKNASKDVVKGLKNDKDKMIAVYDHVAKLMEWDESYGLFISNDLDDIYKEGTGSGSEINMILVQMLREAGLNAHAVTLSTRMNGEVIGLFPFSSQFNHTIAYVEVDNVAYLLDAKNDKRPYNLLPTSVTGSMGLVILKDRLIWIPIQNKGKNGVRKMVSIQVNDEGYTGTITAQNQGFYAFDARTDFDFNDLSQSIEEEVFDEVDDVTVDTAYIRKDVLGESLDYTASFTHKNNSASDVMYLNPMFTEHIDSNPFKVKERTYPVDYDFSFDRSMVVNIQVPEGWQVDEAPQSVLLRLPDQSVEFRRVVQASGNMVVISYKFAVTKERFMPEEYQYLKQMYDQIVTYMSENIVLKKSV